MAKLIGYASGLTEEENDREGHELRNEGVPEDLIYEDVGHGEEGRRKGLSRCLDEIKDGDTLIVCSLNSLAWSVSQLLRIMKELHKRGAHLRSLRHGEIDTTSESGKLIFEVFSVLAQFEKNLVQERVQARGNVVEAGRRKVGRKPLSPHDPRVKAVKKMSQDREISVAQICKALNMSRATYYRFLSMGEVNEGSTPSTADS